MESVRYDDACETSQSFSPNSESVGRTQRVINEMRTSKHAASGSLENSFRFFRNCTGQSGGHTRYYLCRGNEATTQTTTPTRTRMMQTAKQAKENQAKATRRFSTMHTITIALQENNDCTVKALSVVTGLSYGKVHAELKVQGRKNGKGCRRHQQFAAIEALTGKRPVLCEELTERLEGTTTKTLARKLNPNKRYLVYTRAHVSAIVDGGMVDWASDRRKKVKEIFELSV